ncbi:MAG: COX15/CtaA family protein [Alicyclobacillaceae bacterium]|nr:COX15/CtaA family protein [Alicyclobacillaceae bacterium]
MVHRLPVLTTAVIGVQMVLGGIIVGKDAGFVCPDWPLCHGDVLPPLTGLVALELIHRASALLALVLVCWTAVWVWRTQSHRKDARRTVVAALASLLLQVVVGGLIVLFRLPGVVTTVDVVNSMVMLTLFVHLTVSLNKAEAPQSPRPAGGGLGAALGAAAAVRRAAQRLLAAAYLAVVAGAVFRHTGASEALFGEMNYIASHGQHTPPGSVASALMLAAHIATGGLLAAASGRFLHVARREGGPAQAARYVVAMVACQAGTGMMALATRLDFLVATLHWALAGGIVALCSWLVSATSHSMARVPAPGALGLAEPGPVQ